MTGAGAEKGTPVETETNTRPTVVLADSVTITDAVTIGRPDHRGKVHAADVYTRDELQAIVQQAYDKYDVLADPLLNAPMDLDWPDEHPDTVGGALASLSRRGEL